MISEELQRKIDGSIKLLRAVQNSRQNEIIEVAYSCGKDSDVILQLAKEAGINSEDDVMDMLSEIDREELYAKLTQGLEDVEQGKTTPLSEALDEIKEMLEKRRKEIEK